MRYFILILSILFFVGCAQKVDTNNLAMNPSLVQSEYNTYDEQAGKLTTYFFSNKNGILHVRDAITYIPIDVDGSLYSPLSSMTLALKRYSNYQEITVEKILAKNIAQNGYKKVFQNKAEYIVDNDLAFDIKREIAEYERKQQRDDRDKDGVGGEILLIIP